jgi:2Fe-2S ferredoxin
MPRVRVEPAGIEFPVGARETVFAAALKAGLYWPTVCHGQARCTACAVRLVDGRHAVGPPTEAEAAALRGMAESAGRRRPDRDTRLACRLRITGDVTVRKPGVRPEKPGARPEEPGVRPEEPG